MKILIDECLPRRLKYALPEHDVLTVPEAGWAGKKNGELLRLMAGQFDAFITVDSGWQHQQQLTGVPVAFIVVAGKSNTLETLLPLMPAVQTALKTIRPGQMVTIGKQLKS